MSEKAILTLRFMAKRKIFKSILIVCEGTKTEHDYFEFIATHISYVRGIWDNVQVCDNKTVPEDFPLTAPTELGTRKKKKFINPNKRVINERNVLKEICKDLYGEVDGIVEYENVKAVPLRYVAQAQLIEEKQQMYEELWAVFDLDGHTHHQQAYERAERLVNGKTVNIGFSSRSFEHWLLLHFEKNNTQFLSSECKSENDKSLECNAEKGCNGNICLSGYIRTNTPLNEYQKSNNREDLNKMMDLLLKEEYLNNAFENAIWLRETIKNDEALKGKSVMN